MRKQFADIVSVVTNDVDKITEKGSTRPAGQIVHAFLRKRDLIKRNMIESCLRLCFGSSARNCALVMKKRRKREE